MENSLVERAAYKDILDFGGTLSDLSSSKVSNLEKAIINARAYTAEIVNLLKQQDQEAA